MRLKGGGYALPVRLEFLLDRHDLVAALGWNYRDEPVDIDTDDEQAVAAVLIDLTQVAARQLMAEAIRATGQRGYPWWSDGVSEAWAELVQAWAERQVRRCFASAFIRGGSPAHEWGEPLIDALASDADAS